MSAVVAAPTSGFHHVFASGLCSIDVLDLPRTLARRLKDHTLNCTFYVPHSSFCSFSAVSRGQFLELTEQSRSYFDVIQINKLEEDRYVDIYRSLGESRRKLMTEGNNYHFLIQLIFIYLFVLVY